MKIKRIKWKNLALLVLMLIFGILLIISIFNVLKWKLENKKTEIQIEQIEKEDVVEQIEDNEEIEIINPPENKANPYWDYIKMDLINVSFADLLKTNKDVKGWIQVNGTNINYPSVQTTNNSYYLTRSFDKTYNTGGWVFIDYRNKLDGNDKNIIIYAHGRRDNTMFGSLKNILKSDWLNNSNNYVIKLSTDVENTLWQVFSVYRIPNTSDYIEVDFYDDEVYQNFLDMLQNRSAHNFNSHLTSEDKIVTLSTCYNKKEKVVMHAKLIKRVLR